MPQAIPVIIGAVGTAAGATALTIAIAEILAAAAVGLYERDKARKKAREAFSRSLQDRIFTIRSGVAPRKYIVGTVRTGGVLMNADTLGANRSGFDTVIAYAANRCELVSYFVGEENIGLTPTAGKYGKQQLNDIYEEFTVNGPSATISLGGRPVDGAVRAAYHAPGSKPGVATITLAPTGSSATVSGMPSTTSITVSVTYKLETGTKLRLQFKLGTATQDSTQWADFNSDRWTADHRLLGICHARSLYVWDEDLWSSGAQEIGVILKGGPAETPDGVFGFYDPRSGQTLSYTDNPALLWGWWRTLPRKYGGMGVPSDWIDWQYVAIAANICDEPITVRKLDGSGYEQIKRYQCHTELSTDRSAADNEQIILSSMAGKKAFTGGMYRIVAGAFRPAPKTIRDADVDGSKPIAVVNADPSDLPKNVCTARFANAQKNYAESEPKSVRNASYIAADGGEREPLDLSFEGTTDERQVNYLMGVALETQRPAFAVSLTVRGIGEDIAQLDTVTLDLTNRPTYAGRTLEVVSSVDNWDGTYDLTLAEIKATTYALDPDTFTPVNPAEIPDLSYLWNIPAITGFSVDPIGPVLMPDGTSFTRIECTWDAPPVQGVQQGGRIEIRYKSSRGDWITVSPLPGDATATTITAAILDSDIYQFQIRAVSSIGAASPWTDTFLQISGTPIDVKSIRLLASSLIFKVPVSGSGTIEPAVINLDIVRGGGLANAVTWTTTPSGVTLGGSGDHRTLAYADFPTSTDTLKIDVQVDEDNKLFIDRVTIARIRDGADGPDYVPDLTAPPTPTGLTATPALLNNILEWTAPTYTVGHGHSSTEVYGAPVPASGPQPTFANATKLGGTPSTLFTHLAGAGQRYAYWIKFKSVDGVLSSAPAGGTNGVQATPGKIGNTDLNDAIVTAQKLADGSITPQKVAAGAIDATKFASGIEPVLIVTSLPNPAGYTGPKVLLFGGELYRYNGSAWTKAVAVGDVLGDFPTSRLNGQIATTQIADNAISTPKLQANSVTATQLSAGAVRADKLLIAGLGSALNLDPNFVDPSAWVLFAGPSVGSFVTGLADGVAGTTALRSGAPTSVGSWYNGAQRIAIDATKTYRVRGWARRDPSTAANGFLYMGVAAFDSAGGNITGDGSQWSYGAALSVALAGSAWAQFSNVFGAGTSRPFPSNARTMAPLVILNYGGTAGYMECQDLRIEEVLPGTLIQDGAISTNKIQANAITTGLIAAGAVNAQQIAASAITTEKLLVTGQGAALNGDPNGVDPTAWAQGPGTLQFNVDSSLSPTGKVLRSNGNAQFGTRPAFPVVAGKRYRLTFWARQVSGSGPMYARIYQLDSVGNLLAYDTGLENFSLTTSFVRYVGYATGVVNASRTSLEFWTSYTSVGVVDLADIRCEEVIPGELIVDGGITASKIQANTITAGSGIIANAAITNAMIQNLAVDSAKIADGAIVNAKIGSAAVGSANIIDASITNAKIANLSVDTLKIQGNAVTVASQAKLGAAVNYPLGNQFYDVLSLVIVTTGAPVWVNGMVAQGYRMQILRDGGVVYDSLSPQAQGPGKPAPPTVGFALDQPSAGAHTYTLRIWESPWAAVIDTAAIVTLETKK
jgi:hypothetical protein